MKIVEISDFLRGRDEIITIRFNPEDLIELPCDCIYSSDLNALQKVIILKRIEVYKGGKCVPYPSVAWLDGVENDTQLVTRAFVKTEEEFKIMTSPEGVPDGRLMVEAQKAGVFTEIIS